MFAFFIINIKVHGNFLFELKWHCLLYTSFVSTIHEQYVYTIVSYVYTDVQVIIYKYSLIVDVNLLPKIYKMVNVDLMWEAYKIFYIFQIVVHYLSYVPRIHHEQPLTVCLMIVLHIKVSYIEC